MTSENNFKVINLFEGSNIIERAESAKSEIDCKFVHLTDADSQILIYGPLHKYRYHAQLIEHYCHQNRIETSWEHKPDQLELVNSDLKINGGGWFKLNPSLSLLKIYGYSTAYGGFNEAMVQGIISNDPILSQFALI